MVSSMRSQRSQAPPMQQAMEQEGSRWSGGSLTPSNGYSSLFTSGLMRTHTPQTPPPARPSHSTGSPTSPDLPHPIPFPQASPYIPSPSRRRHASPNKTRSPSKLRPAGSPAKRRAPPSPSKPNPCLAADRALTDVMNKLRLYAASPAKRVSPIKQSRWSSSSEESGNGDGEGFWKPRKSGESTRSKVTMKSKKSTWSLRSRKSEDGERPEEDRPPMPPLPGAGKKEGNGQVPVTPGRGRRVVEGLARRLGLTSKKKNAPPTPSRQAPPPELPPIPAPSIPRKSSLCTLRTLAKKTSTGTLRSAKSIYGHPIDSPPDLPTIPTTPRRMPKSSIGPPKNGRGGVSPSLFDTMPRKAPKTPDRSEDVDVEVGLEKMDVDEIITFPSSTPKMDDSPATPRAHEDFSNASEFLTSTPVSQRYNSSGGNTPILTAKAAQQSGKTPSKPRRLLDLLPTYQKLRSQSSTPDLPKPGSYGGPPRTSSRQGLHLGSITRDPLGSLSQNASTVNLPYRVAGWDNPSIPIKPEIQRPATSQGHYKKPTMAQEDYHNYPSQTRPKTHYRSRRVPDFSRPMSKQDLSMSISSSAHLDADTSWSANIDNASTELHQLDLIPTRAERQSPGHERMNSNSSLITTESTESFGTAHTAQTALSGVSGQSSGLGEFELERYLREMESEDESLQTGRDNEEVLSGVSGRKGGAVIQQARYGIRI